MNCISTGGQYVPPVYITTDLNESGRSSAFLACLFSNGWRPVKNKEEAHEVTNSVSRAETSPPSDAALAAGRSYCDGIFKSDHNVAMMAVFKNDYNLCVAERSRELQTTH